MHNKLIHSNNEYFVVSSGNFAVKLDRLSLPPSDANTFFGYCFQDDRYYHYKFLAPDVEKIYESYDINCGVFCCLRQSGPGLEVFTDPLAQYPVFYYHHDDEFVVSNNFWIIAFLLEGEIDYSCAYDYVTYLSPLCGDTLLKGVKRLRAFQTIRIEKSLVISTRPYPAFTKQNYKHLIKEAGQRLRTRARALLQIRTPLLHLTGGSDSRLAFSALAVEGYRGPVFSFGDGNSQDRLIFEQLVEKFSLQKGAIKWFCSGQQTGHHFMRAVHAFQAFKSNSFSNWGPGHNYDYMEVTGYFGEGLLKGFGEFWGNNNRLIVFDFAKKASNFPIEIFDHSLSRVQRDLDIFLEHVDGSRRMANSLFYINNRSAAHFGMHTVVSNSKFFSVDLLYDPQLLRLLYNCPHSDDEIKRGSLIIDLIRTVHSEELAHFPYENRVIPTFDRRAEKARRGSQPTCFHDVKFNPLTLPPLRPEIIKEPDEILERLRQFPLKHFGQREMFKNDLFDKLFADLPELIIARYTDVQKVERPAENIALSSLAISRWFLEPDRLNQFV